MWCSSCPLDMARAGAMAGLTGDADVGPGSVVTVFRQSVVLLQVGGVAIGAHEVPVLQWAGPVQDVAVVDLFVGVEMEPPLASRGGGSAVPGDAQGLITSIRKSDEILLERVYAKGIGDLVVV